MEQCRYGPGFHTDMDGNSSIQQILIPANKVGLVIGKGGDTIKQLQVGCQTVIRSVNNSWAIVNGAAVLIE